MWPVQGFTAYMIKTLDLKQMKKKFILVKYAPAAKILPIFASNLVALMSKISINLKF